MAEQIDPNVALEKVSKAIRAGQKEYDKLPQEVKDAAKVAAEGSLGSDDEYSPTEPIEREDYNPIPSFGREKAADAPLFQDLKTGEDFARLGLEAASMSPIGQAAQAGADVGIAGMDIAAGDYTGAAISGAAVLLPFVSAGVLKSLMKHAPDRTKALEDAFTAGDLSEDALKEELKQLQLSTIGLPLDELDPSKANKPLRSVIERQQRNLRGTRFVETAHDVSPKYGLEDMRGRGVGGTPVIRDLGPLTENDVYQLKKGNKSRGLNEAELRQLRDEYEAYGYDDFETAGHRSDALGPDGKPINPQYGLASQDEVDALIKSDRVPYNPGGKAKPPWTTHEMRNVGLLDTKMKDSERHLRRMEKLVSDKPNRDSPPKMLEQAQKDYEAARNALFDHPNFSEYNEMIIALEEGTAEL